MRCAKPSPGLIFRPTALSVIGLLVLSLVMPATGWDTLEAAPAGSVFSGDSRFSLGFGYNRYVADWEDMVWDGDRSRLQENRFSLEIGYRPVERIALTAGVGLAEASAYELLGMGFEPDRPIRHERLPLGSLALTLTAVGVPPGNRGAGIDLCGRVTVFGSCESRIEGCFPYGFTGPIEAQIKQTLSERWEAQLGLLFRVTTAWVSSTTGMLVLPSGMKQTLEYTTDLAHGTDTGYMHPVDPVGTYLALALTCPFGFAFHAEGVRGGGADHLRARIATDLPF